MPPTGKEVTFFSMQFNRVVGGKVEEHWVELELLGLMQQLGAFPEPGHLEETCPTYRALAEGGLWLTDPDTVLPLLRIVVLGIF